MIRQFLNSTKSLTGRLALFFTLVSCVTGLITYAILVYTLKWTEDEVGEKRIILDSKIAIARYQSGENGKLQIDFLTDAYNDLSLVPQEYLEYTGGSRSFIGEVEKDDGLSRMLYITQYQAKGVTKPLIMLSRIDEIELSPYEMLTSIALVLGIFALLQTTFTLILMRLSKSLISPLNSLSEQLERCQGDPNFPFTINSEAAVEFAQLTEQLNHYRSEINALIKREQIFARYASHELRTPLTIIRGANELLQRGEHNDFQKRQLTRIKGASKQMATMVDALLGLVRYERGNSEIALRKVTEDELRSIINDHHSALLNKDNSVQLTICGEPQIRASTAIISMIVGNLLRNALSATNKGRIEVRMDNNSISVLDEGSGLTEEPFAQGHGLGLLLVEDLCRRYNWRFTLANRRGKGAIAKILFS